MTLARLRWLILFLLFLSTVINYVDRQALSVLLPTLRSELGISSSEYGTITTLFLTAYTIGQLFAGIVIDRIGTRRGFALSILFWSLAAMAHAFARGLASFGLLRFALGIGEAGNWPAGGKAVAQWFPQQRRAFGMAVFDSGSAVGAILAPPMVAALALYFGWRVAFIVTGALGFLWLAAWWWIYQTPEEHRWLSETDRAIALQEIGCIPYLTVDIGKLIGGAGSDRLLARGHSATFARKSVMVAGALAMAAGVLVVGAQTSAGAITWVCVATFGFGLWSANILALHADIFPTETLATAVGLTGMASSLGGSIFTYTIGLMVDRTGYAPVFGVAGTLALLACVALFV